ncbi:MAG: cytochrome c-type biogenesis protein [Gammaproteobacteria bacterium]
MRTFKLWLLLVCLSATVSAGAAIDTYPFSNDENRKRFQALTSELRCPKCQNQNIADSNAEIAKDLRAKVFLMLEKGQTDQQVIDYMTERYGDFVLYEPRFNAETVLLWAGPALLLFLGMGVVFWLSRRSSTADTEHDTPSLVGEQERRLKKILDENKD